MAAALRGIDILSFTGGIGEHAADIRARTCERLAFLGIELDPNTNAATHGDGAIGAASSRVFVSVVTAREEAAIAREVEHLLAPAPMG
jgi:acetate kinase